MAIKKIRASAIGPQVFSTSTIINQIITSTNDPIVNTAPTKINTAAIEDSAITDAKLNSTGLDISKFTTGTFDPSLITNSTVSIDKLNASGTRNGDTFLAGNNTFKALTIPPSIITAARYQTWSNSTNNATPTRTTTLSYTSTTNATLIKITANITGVVNQSGNNAGVSSISNTTSGTLIGAKPEFIRQQYNLSGTTVAYFSNGSIGTAVSFSFEIATGFSGNGNSLTASGVAVWEEVNATS